MNTLEVGAVLYLLGSVKDELGTGGVLVRRAGILMLLSGAVLSIGEELVAVAREVPAFMAALVALTSPVVYRDRFVDVLLRDCGLATCFAPLASVVAMSARDAAVAAVVLSGEQAGTEIATATDLVPHVAVALAITALFLLGTFRCGVRDNRSGYIFAAIFGTVATAWIAPDSADPREVALVLSLFPIAAMLLATCRRRSGAVAAAGSFGIALGTAAALAVLGMRETVS